MRQVLFKIVIIYILVIALPSCVKAVRSDLSLNSEKGLLFYLVSLIYRGPDYVAVGIKNKVTPVYGLFLYSYDGKTWLEGSFKNPDVTSTSSTLISDTAFGSNKWVAAGYSNDAGNFYCKIWNSADGTNWTLSTCPFTAGAVMNTVFGNGFFLAAAFEQLNGVLNCRIIKSTDGMNWSVSTSSVPGTGTCGNSGFFLAFNKTDGQFYVTSTDTQPANRGYYKSGDGVNWTAIASPTINITTPTSYRFYPVSTGLLGMVSNGANLEAVSYNGSWTTSTNVFASTTTPGNPFLTAANSKYFILGTTSPYYYYSTDFNNWTGSSYTCSATSCQFLTMHYRPKTNLFTSVIVKSTSAPYPLEFVYSSDGMNWTTGNTINYNYADSPTFYSVKTIDD